MRFAALFSSCLCLLFCTVPAHAGDPASSPAGGIANQRFLANSQITFQPGEAVRIAAFPDSGGSLSGTYFIDAEGNVDLPLIGLVAVANQTPRDLELYLTSRYLAYLPKQDIIVRLMYRTALLGGFHRPGLYWADPRGTLWDVVQQGGGTLREDGIGLIHWVRGGEVVSSDITPYFKTNRSLLSIGYQPGDELTVTPKPRKNAWEYFAQNIVPVLSLAVTCFLTVEVYRHWYQ